MPQYRVPTKRVSDVSAYVQRQFGDESGVQVTDPDIIRWVNAAEQEIFASNQIGTGSASASTVVGQENYSLGASLEMQSINSIRCSGVKLEFMQFNDAEEYISRNDPSKTARGMPQFWYEWGGVVMLYPVPDLVYDLTIFFFKTPTPLTNLTDVLNSPDQYFNRVIDFVMREAYKMDEQWEAAAVMDASFENKLLAQSLDSMTPQMATYPNITVGWDDL